MPSESGRSIGDSTTLDVPVSLSRRCSHHRPRIEHVRRDTFFLLVAVAVNSTHIADFFDGILIWRALGRFVLQIAQLISINRSGGLKFGFPHPVTVDATARARTVLRLLAQSVVVVVVVALVVSSLFDLPRRRRRRRETKSTDFCPPPRCRAATTPRRVLLFYAMSHRRTTPSPARHVVVVVVVAVCIVFRAGIFQGKKKGRN